MSIRFDIRKFTTETIRKDLKTWGITQRKAAKELGIAPSTFHAFLNCEYHSQHRRTLEKLLSAPIWSQPTRENLEKLLHFEDLAFRGQLNEAADSGREQIVRRH